VGLGVENHLGKGINKGNFIETDTPMRQSSSIPFFHLTKRVPHWRESILETFNDRES